jgi:tRNA pseudouridine38-40 synthase
MEKKYRIFMNLAYDGADYFGWQIQPHSSPTIQGVLEEKLSQLFNVPIRVIGSGRTDRGANALSQWAHADLPRDPQNMNLCHRLNRLTPDTLLIKKIVPVSLQLHAQRSVLRKKYIYRIHTDPYIHPLKMKYSYHVRAALNVESLKKLATYMVGTHDFKSFQTSGSDVENTVRTIYKCRWQQDSPHDFSFHIVGNGFLKQMVRNIVGSHLWCAAQKAPEREFQHIFKAMDRRIAKESVPAHALFLKWVKYPDELDIKCRKL